MTTFRTPGVSYEPWKAEPKTVLHTGVPGFLCFLRTPAAEKALAEAAPVLGEERMAIPAMTAIGRNRSQRQDAKPSSVPNRYTRWDQFEDSLNTGGRYDRQLYPGLMESFSFQAIKGFFANGGMLCYVLVIVLPAEGNGQALTTAMISEGLEAFSSIGDVDLICVPDIMQLIDENDPAATEQMASIQKTILAYCDGRGDCFALLDSMPNTGLAREQRRLLGSASNGALYYPWIEVLDGPDRQKIQIPPCGHVAGVIARSDQRVGVHKAPANEVLEGVVDLTVHVTDAQQGELNAIGVNCLRAFPGRGIRVWGARTLSYDAAWTYVNVRRIFQTAIRWIEQSMTHEVFEPHDPSLWARITRDLTAYFSDLYRAGALQGPTAESSFYVKCDEETNPQNVRERGQIISEIGLAAARPYEYIVVRIVQSVGGTTIEGPSRTA